jgi:hypothetical protein
MEVNLTPLQQAIWRTLAYADVFDYPLRLEEIQRYLVGMAAPLESVKAVLEQSSYLFIKTGEFYSLPERESIISVRERREKVAVCLWRDACNYGRVIAGLPFVRMVAVTGSLAMNNVEANADIDYLIITAPTRLWLCRLFVLIAVRLAALQGVSLCPNFFLTQNALSIPQQSYYAAHEFAQMVPLSGLDIYERMRSLNQWVNDFLPNANGVPRIAGEIPHANSAYWIRPLLEVILMTSPVNWLELWEMDRKIRKLSRENMGNPEAIFTGDQCKGHSNQHAHKTEALLNERLAHFSLEVIIE